MAIFSRFPSCASGVPPRRARRNNPASSLRADLWGCTLKKLVRIGVVSSMQESCASDESHVVGACDRLGAATNAQFSKDVFDVSFDCGGFHAQGGGNFCVTHSTCQKG